MNCYLMNASRKGIVMSELPVGGVTESDQSNSLSVSVNNEVENYGWGLKGKLVDNSFISG